ncbi:hypothetical protein [Streptomyces spirodelae]|uniref:Uncharacterized protein n=1 Tax=Streptomyces spirodelae TaxID=2812904 RepID=A0ABS3X3X5_9ACTN|nr:hypothetical protein [Streptomyces spirodelae]MBO8190075.1 hypothetical protein [Streptomyces spirodelae]
MAFYLLFGFLYLTGVSSPFDLAQDLTAGERPARRAELALSLAVWCAALSLWPLVVALRAAEALRCWTDQLTAARRPGHF